MEIKQKVREVYSISVKDFFKKHREKLELSLVGEKVGFDRKIEEQTPNRPGLALSGFFEYFAPKRIQVLGNSEISYLEQLPPGLRIQRFQELADQKIPCFVIAREQVLPEEVIKTINDNNIAIFTTPLITMSFLNLATIHLEEQFAPQTSLHGCMIDYRGIGVLIMGKSGSGKSETALGLLEKGAALVADDLVRINNIGGELRAHAPEMAQGFIEMRGIGIINVANLYGLSAIRPEKTLDLVVQLKPASDLNNVDRLGMRRENVKILDCEIPVIEIPVAAGRDTARLVAVAALDLQLRKLGYDMADEFNQRLMNKMNAQ